MTTEGRTCGNCTYMVTGIAPRGFCHYWPPDADGRRSRVADFDLACSRHQTKTTETTNNKEK